MRGKEGAGHQRPEPHLDPIQGRFPSPCGVRRVRDGKASKYLFHVEGHGFPSPCGVRRVRDPWFLETLYDAVFKVRF